MTEWRNFNLDTIEAADELEIASVGGDGGLGEPTTTWVVRVNDEFFLRAVNGRSAAWFRDTRVRHEGRISAGGVTQDVTFVDADTELDERIDEPHPRKCRRYSANIVDSVVTPRSRAATIRLIPRSTTP